MSAATEPSTDAVAHLLAPVTAGRLSLRNRVVMPAHTTNFAVAGRFSPQHLAYHRERAAGGVALIVTEGMRVHPTSLGRSNTVAAFDDGIVESLNGLADVVHAEGAKLAAQLLHVGRQAGGHNSLSAAWGASPLPWAGTASVPHEMTVAEIAEVVAGFGAAAARVAAAGVDAVEVHLGHGHLLQQFLSPASNRRSDAYGGSAANRLRLTHEVMAAVAAALPADLPVLLRVSADEFLPGGLGLSAMIDVVGDVLAEHRVDVLHVSHSAYVADGSVATQIADMSFPPHPFRHLPRAVAAAFPDVDVLAVCRLDTLEAAAELVAAGDASLVGLARAHIATPDLVRRAEAAVAGTHEPAPRHDCIACNQGCTGRLELGLPISCVANPEAGLEREWRDLRTSAQSDGDLARDVLVVGAGPAGLNAAVAAAEAGHRVVLRDRQPVAGGTLRLAAQLPTRTGFALLVDQLLARALRAGVRVELGLEVCAGDLVGPDAVVLATGGRPRVEPIDVTLGATPIANLVEAPDAAGGHVVLVDEEGSWAGLAVAEHLVAAGARVTLCCAQAALAWRVPVYSKPAALDRLRASGRFGARLLVRAVARDGDGLVLRDVMSGEHTTLPAVSSLAVIRPPQPELTLVEAARAAGVEPLVAGDAYAPRTALEAAFEGRRAGFAVASSRKAVAAATIALSGRL